MVTTKLAIHIRPGAYPESIIAIVDSWALQKERSFSHSVEYLGFVNSLGFGTYNELKTVPHEMGLISSTTNGIQLTPFGLTFSKLRENSKVDILHFLMYTGWNKLNPTEFLPSWAYQRCCNTYWDQQKVDLTTTFMDIQVEEIINEARDEFERLKIEKFDEVSFGRRSIKGLLKWLEALNPAVIDGTSFSRRSFCSPELLIMAIGFILRDEADVIDIDILLTREKREAICRICLLNPADLDSVLDWTIPVFPDLISGGTTAGYYGRFIRLLKFPTIQDIVR